MGLIGIPRGRTLRVSRDLDVLKYAGGRLHLATITCAESVEMVREAKRAGLNVTCGTTAAHLMFCDKTWPGLSAPLGCLLLPHPKRPRVSCEKGCWMEPLTWW